MPTLMNGNNFLLKRRKSTNTLQITYFCRNLNKPVIIVEEAPLKTPRIQRFISCFLAPKDVILKVASKAI